MVNAAENDRLVWIDCEMTGLDLSVDQIVEVAVIVTDCELTALDPGFQIVVRADDSVLAGMNGLRHADAPGIRLLEEIPQGVTPLRPKSRCWRTSAACSRG